MARRQTFWVDNLIDIGVTSGGSNFASLMAGTPPINTRGTTIVRIVFDLKIFSQTIAGAHGVNAIDLGFGMASQEAFGVGLTALPNPNADERPVGGWMYRTRCIAYQNGVGTNPLIECKDDLHSGRKITDGEPFLIAENTALLGTSAAYEIAGIVRLLLLLP